MKTSVVRNWTPPEPDDIDYKVGDRVVHRFVRTVQGRPMVGTVVHPDPHEGMPRRYVSVLFDHKTKPSNSRRDHIRLLSIVERIGELDATG